MRKYVKADANIDKHRRLVLSDENYKLRPPLERLFSELRRYDREGKEETDDELINRLSGAEQSFNDQHQDDPTRQLLEISAYVKALRVVLRGLPRKHKDILVLRIVKRRSFERIGERVGISRQRVAQIFEAALHKMGRQITNLIFSPLAIQPDK